MFAADKGEVPAAIVVEPHHSCFHEIQAVRISAPVWLSWIVWSWIPEFDFPGSAVCPLPSSLLLNVVASQPNNASETFSIPLIHVFLGGIGGNRGQVSALLLAKVLSIGPLLLVVAPEVAVVAVLLPAFFAGFDALVPAAVGS